MGAWFHGHKVDNGGWLGAVFIRRFHLGNLKGCGSYITDAEAGRFGIFICRQDKNKGCAIIGPGKINDLKGCAAGRDRRQADLTGLDIPGFRRPGPYKDWEQNRQKKNQSKIDHKKSFFNH